MVMQAWGNYGTAWSVVHQQLGVRPYLNDGVLQVVPQVPPGQPSVAGSNIRLGRGSVGVFASHSNAGYTTKVDATRTPVRELVIGHTLPHGSKPAAVVLDGHRVKHYDARETNRGLEVIGRRAPGRAAHADDRDPLAADDAARPPERAGSPQAAEAAREPLPSPASTRAASTRLCTPRRR